MDLEPIPRSLDLAYVANIYGNDGVALAAIYVASLTVLYNIQAVVALTPKGQESGQKAVQVIVKTLTKNPLIIAISLGVVFYALSIPVPKMVSDAGQYFANMTLPLSTVMYWWLVSIFGSLKKDQAPTWFATGYKLILAPLIITIGALFFGF